MKILKPTIHLSLTIATLFIPYSSYADESKHWLRLGPGHIIFDESAKLSIAGNEVPGGDVSISEDTTIIAELGYNISQNFALGFTFGIPPTSKVNGSGAISAAGRLGKVHYAPSILSGQYRFHNFGNARPYVGVGAVYYKVLDTDDGAIENLSVDDGWGTVLQAGVELPLSGKAGFFLDLKKIFVSVDGGGSLPAAGGAPISANVQLDPWVIQSGLSFKF